MNTFVNVISGKDAQCKRKCLTTEQKLQVIDKIKENPKISMRGIAKQYNVGYTQIQNIWKKRILLLLDLKMETSVLHPKS